ncbi:hypothetical protein IGI67_002556 [Enterococcus sp. AZ196]
MTVIRKHLYGAWANQMTKLHTNVNKSKKIGNEEEPT